MPRLVFPVSLTVYVCVLCVYVCVCMFMYHVPDSLCVCGMLQEIGVLLWKSDSKRLMVVSRAGHDQVKRFWKKKDR